MTQSQTPVVLITGATAGIGYETALELARRGAHVIAAGRRRERLDALKAEAQGLRLDVVELDVTDAGSIERARDEVLRLSEGRGLDALVNNAGYGMVAPTLETTDADLRRQYETNVFGLMAVTRAFVPQMVERGQGRLINVSSIGGRLTLPFFGAYNSTKYAVESLSDALRRELAPLGVRVSLIEPGPIKTEFADHSMSYVEQYKDPSSPWAAVYDRADEIRAQTDRFSGKPRDVARAITHAVFARRPRVRYVMPLSSRLSLFMLSWLPTPAVDALFGWMLGLGAARAVPPAKPASKRAGASPPAHAHS